MRLILKGIAYLVIGLFLAVAFGILVGGPIYSYHDAFHCSWWSAICAYLEMAGGIIALCAVVAWAIYTIQK